MCFDLRKRKENYMCKKLSELNGKKPVDFLSKVSEIPIDIGGILDKWKILFCPVDFKDLENNLQIKRKISGMAYAEGDDLMILYSENLAENEWRFTLAHELAHCCLHMDVDSSCHVELQMSGDILGNFSGELEYFNRRKEQEADDFARELLMPEQQLIFLLKNTENPNLKILSDYFLVPQEHMKIRLEQLNRSI